MIKRTIQLFKILLLIILLFIINLLLSFFIAIPYWLVTGKYYWNTKIFVSIQYWYLNLINNL